MRAFSTVRQELGLRRFLASPLGTLHLVPFKPRGPRVMVRHFDAELPAELVQSYVNLTRAVHQWVAARPELKSLIRIEQPTEVGVDFVARPHHIYHTSIRSYDDWEDAPEQPPELEQMRRALRTAISERRSEKEVIIGQVLARSLLEPTGKTYFHEGEGCFIVVEPKLTRQDVERWAAMSGPTAG